MEICGERPKKGFLDARLLKHLISCAEYKFGDRVPGSAYRERGNAGRIDDLDFEIDTLIPIYINLMTIYSSDQSLCVVDSDNLRISHFQKMLDILRPWFAKLDLISINRTDGLVKKNMNVTLEIFSPSERHVAIIHTNRNEVR